MDNMDRGRFVVELEDQEGERIARAIVGALVHGPARGALLASIAETDEARALTVLRRLRERRIVAIVSLPQGTTWALGSSARQVLLELVRT